MPGGFFATPQYNRTPTVTAGRKGTVIDDLLPYEHERENRCQVSGGRPACTAGAQGEAFFDTPHGDLADLAQHVSDSMTRQLRLITSAQLAANIVTAVTVVLGHVFALGLALSSAAPHRPGLGEVFKPLIDQTDLIITGLRQIIFATHCQMHDA